MRLHHNSEPAISIARYTSYTISVTRTFAFFFLLLMAVPALAAPPLTLTLPDSGAYSYWIQSKSGTVTNLPVNISRTGSVKITQPVAAGDRLFVLDAHTGGIAARAVSVAGGVPAPMTLTVADFQPVAPPVPVAAAPASPVAPSAPAAVPDKAGGIGRLVTGLFSLILAAGVAWVVYRLVETRGEPLRQAARRFGLETPEPAPLEADDSETTLAAYTPTKRAPEPVPEEAGLSVGATAAQRGPQMTLPDSPALIGLQGIAAGSTFALTAGDLTIGRDGENEIVLAENTVSRQHARVLRDGQGQWTLTDLESANGVYINGMRVQRAVLSMGDEIKIGDNYFRFHADKEP